MKPYQRKRAILAIAACFNSTYVYSPEYLRNPEIVRQMVISELEDYFDEGGEADQFDRDDTMEYVRTEPLDSLVNVLDEMGKNPFSQNSFHVVKRDGKAISMWEAFVDRLVAREPVSA